MIIDSVYLTVEKTRGFTFWTRKIIINFFFFWSSVEGTEKVTLRHSLEVLVNAPKRVNGD